MRGAKLSAWMHAVKQQPLYLPFLLDERPTYHMSRPFFARIYLPRRLQPLCLIQPVASVSFHETDRPTKMGNRIYWRQVVGSLSQEMEQRKRIFKRCALAPIKPSTLMTPINPTPYRHLRGHRWTWHRIRGERVTAGIYLSWEPLRYRLS